VKFGVRKFSLTKRVAARTSLKRVIRHNLGLKAPRGWGWLTNPKKAAYNRVYNRTTISAENGLGLFVALLAAVGQGAGWAFRNRRWDVAIVVIGLLAACWWLMATQIR
jgi:hypothetical protein